MKYLKTYESLVEKNDSKFNAGKVGDYVICQDNISGVSKFIFNKIGQVIVIDIVEGVIERIHVQYTGVPEDIKKRYFDHNNTIVLYPDEIEYFSSDKEDCDVYLVGRKYNI